jgi:hypothetical protein
MHRNRGVSAPGIENWQFADMTKRAGNNATGRASGRLEHR